jgi:hypothetical protein
LPVDDASPEFAQAAAEDGLEFEHRSFDWLSEQGHLGLLRVAQERRDPALKEPVTAAVEALTAIYARLKGDAAVLPNNRERMFLPIDLFHEPTGTLIELDEALHFTSFRLTALKLYPPDTQLGFDLEEHKALAKEWAPKTDRISHGLAAKGFGFGGVQRQRAYQDAVRDLGTPAMGHPPLVRVVALDGDGAAAYRRDRDRLLKLLTP